MVKHNKSINNNTLNKKKNKTKTEVINVRVSEDEKKRLEKKAALNNMKLSEFLRSSALNSKKQPAETTQKNAQNTVIVQRICTYIAENYGEDKLLEKWSSILWENLS